MKTMVGVTKALSVLGFEELIPQHELNGSSLAREVDAWAQGGYFRLGQQWVQVKESTLGWSLTTTWLQAQFAAGRQQPIRDRESERRGEYAFQSINRWGNHELYGIVIDPQLAQAAGGGGPYRAPSRTESTRVLHDWKGFTDATMQVRLTEWFLSLDKSWYPLPGLQVGLSAGPTVNWLQTDLLSVSGWEGADGRQLADAAERQRRQQLLPGVGVDARVKWSLDAMRRAWLEASLGYRWVAETGVGAGGAQAEIDANAWTMSLGVSLLLGEWAADSPWTVRGGGAVQQFNWNVATPSASQLRQRFPRRGGRGDVGHFKGERVFYDDGAVGADLFPNERFFLVVVVGGETLTFYERGYVLNSSQIRRIGPNRDAPSGGLSPYQVPNALVHFHSSAFRQQIRGVQMADAEVTDLGWGAAFHLDRELFEGESWSLGFSLGWVGSQSNRNVSRQTTASVTVDRQTQTYMYPYLASVAFNQMGRGPQQVSLAITQLVRNVPNNGPYLQRPGYLPAQVSPWIHETLVYDALVSASLNASLNSLPLELSAAWRPLPRLELAISGGPTLNVLRADAVVMTEWTLRGAGGRVPLWREFETGTTTAFRLGASAQLQCRWDLDAVGQWFVEASAGYHYLAPMDVKANGQTIATLDASSWQAGISLGCRLGRKPSLRWN
jgi:hypothetical protein